MDSKSVVNRWRISGRLTFRSPLHVGNGAREERKDIAPRDAANNEVSVEVATIERDARGVPVIPGSTIKGVLRSAFPKAGRLAELRREIFGFEEPPSGNRDAGGVGGKAEFWFASLTDSSIQALGQLKPIAGQLPHWDGARFVAVRTGVTIDRDFRRAADERLFYQEYVPAGSEFRVTVSGRNMDTEEVSAILWALEQFNVGTLRIGSNTSDGCGDASWELDEISGIESKQELESWLASGRAYEALPEKDISSFRKHAKRLAAEASPPSSPRVQISLRFDGAFLSKHPIYKKTSASDTDAVSIRNAKGKPYLASYSFAGSMRSQAERILRTLGLPACDCSQTRKACSLPDDTKRTKAGKPDVSSLCLVCQLFGSQGWKSPLRFSDFVSDGSGKEYRQEFVSIDRFTGGSSAKRKFNSTALYAPVLEGSIDIDQERMAHIDRAAWGLLALTLRDLHEGDITFGHGASKGYGQCRASIQTDTIGGELEAGILALRSSR